MGCRQVESVLVLSSQDSSPAVHTYWPSGFYVRPWQFLRHQPVWRALIWSAILSVLFLPAVIATVILLPWLPLSARAADSIGRLGARWMGVTVPDRRVNRWFDWQQTAELIALLFVSFVSFLVNVFLGFFTAVLAATPFLWAQDDLRQGTGIDLNFLQIDHTGVIVAFLLIAAAASALVLIYVGWVITGCSVAATVASNSTTSSDVADLTRSRAVLADAFTGERRRIERELHDGAQQYLTALQLNVAALEMTARTGQELAEPMDKVKANARQALESLRATVRGIYPQVLADKGLVAAVDELVSHSGLDHRFVLVGEEDAFELTDTPALLLYHCTAEALTNAVKHGGADTVRVTLSDDNGHTVLTVDDNGVGTGTGASTAKVAAASDEGGTGIAGLKERAAALGGTVQLSDLGTSQGQWTTRLETRLP